MAEVALPRIPGEIERESQDTKRRSTQRESTREETLGRIRSFDPMSYMRDASTGLMAGVGDQFQSLLGRNAVSNNRRGIHGSPIGQFDASRAATEALTEGLNRISMQGAQMAGQNIDRLGNVSALDRQDYNLGRDRELDLMTAQAEHELQMRNAKKKKGGGWLDIIGDVAGLIPGIGTAVETGIDIFKRW